MNGRLKINMEDVPILVNIDMNNRREINEELEDMINNINSSIPDIKLDRFVVEYIKDNIGLERTYDYEMIIESDNITEIYKLDKYNIIGKKSDEKVYGKIEIDNNYVSKVHIFLFIDKMGKLLIIDLNSTYGLYILKKMYIDNNIKRMRLSSGGLYMVKKRGIYQISDNVTLRFVKSNTQNNRLNEINMINYNDMSPISFRTVCNTKSNSLYESMGDKKEDKDTIQIRRLSFDDNNNKEYIIESDKEEDEEDEEESYYKGMSRYQCEFDFEYE